MRITIVSVGTYGDAQPYVALARGLMRAGHHVKLATHEDFRELVTSHQVLFEPICGSFRAVLESPEGREVAYSANLTLSDIHLNQGSSISAYY